MLYYIIYIFVHICVFMVYLYICIISIYLYVCLYYDISSPIIFIFSWDSDDKNVKTFVIVLQIPKCLFVCLSIYLAIYFLKKFIYVFIYLFWLCWVFVAAHGLSLVVASRGYSSLRCMGFSLRWLLLLRSMGSRHVGFSSCSSWAQ